MTQEHKTRNENFDSTKKRYLNFSLGTEEYAILLLTVKEVIAVPDITPIPFSLEHYLGIMNLRGQVISVIDLRIKLDIKPIPNAETAIIICDMGNFSLGVVVDSINSVISPAETDISEKPKMENSKNADYITGVVKQKEKLVILLDIINLLSIEEIKTFSNSNLLKSS